MSSFHYFAIIGSTIEKKLYYEHTLLG